MITSQNTNISLNAINDFDDSSNKESACIDLNFNNDKNNIINTNRDEVEEEEEAIVHYSSPSSNTSEFLEENLTEEEETLLSSDESTETSLVEEDLEAKKRQLHKEAKLLLKKNKKLRKNFAITDDFMIQNINNKKINQENDELDEDEESNSLSLLRKSQRKRKKYQKFKDEEYALDEEDEEEEEDDEDDDDDEEEEISLQDTSSSNSQVKSDYDESIDSKTNNNNNYESSNLDNLDVDKKGLLKLRIKRVPLKDEKISFSSALIDPIEMNNNNSNNNNNADKSELTSEINEPINIKISNDLIINDKQQTNKQATIKLNLNSPKIETNLKLSPSNLIVSPKLLSSAISPLSTNATLEVRKNIPITRATSKLLKQQSLSTSETNLNTDEQPALSTSNNILIVNNDIYDNENDEDYQINYDDDDDNEDDEDYNDDDYEDTLEIPDIRSRHNKDLIRNKRTKQIEISKSLNNSFNSSIIKSNHHTITTTAAANTTPPHFRRAKTLANRKRTNNSNTNKNEIVFEKPKEDNSKLGLNKNDILYDSNINKIVDELKSIGSCKLINKDDSNEKESEESPKKSSIDYLFRNQILKTRYIKKNILLPVPIFDIAKSSASFTRNLLKQHSFYIVNSLNNTDKNQVDTSIINDILNMKTNQLDLLPSITNLFIENNNNNNLENKNNKFIMNLNIDLIKKITKHNKKYNKKRIKSYFPKTNTDSNFELTDFEEPSSKQQQVDNKLEEFNNDKTNQYNNSTITKKNDIYLFDNGSTSTSNHNCYDNTNLNKNLNLNQEQIQIVNQQQQPIPQQQHQSEKLNQQQYYNNHQNMIPKYYENPPTNKVVSQLPLTNSNESQTLMQPPPLQFRSPQSFQSSAYKMESPYEIKHTKNETINYNNNSNQHVQNQNAYYGNNNQQNIILNNNNNNMKYHLSYNYPNNQYIMNTNLNQMHHHQL